MSSAKTILSLMMLGALLGAVVASFVVPPVLVWYNEPGAISPTKPVETLCNMPELIRYATRRLLEGQLIGAAIGAAIFLVLGIILTRRRTATADVTVVR
jgi:hypothetical protein